MAKFEVDPLFQVLREPELPEAKALHAYWQSLRTGNELPTRSSIKLDEVAKLGCADRIFIMDPLPNGDWQYRLLGSEIVRYFGRDVTGVPFRRHMRADEAEEAIKISNQVAESRTPIFLKVRFASGDHIGIVETMSLPILARDQNRVWLFGGSFFTPDH
ncbi:MAG: PAS domain-containing protein [Alphaproteobacteria bacterium]